LPAGIAGASGIGKAPSRELGQFNIRVNAIAPGAVAGDRIERVLRGRATAEQNTLEEEMDSAMAIQSLKRFVDPKDIAALIVFLTSDAGKSISGPVLPIDRTHRPPPSSHLRQRSGAARLATPMIELALAEIVLWP
jgi:NAD(P)-dependent dehydrogenase (short-subunit alcohol dehydrogenase family)